jgi:hypothetical protein
MIFPRGHVVRHQPPLILYGRPHQTRCPLDVELTEAICRGVVWLFPFRYRKRTRHIGDLLLHGDAAGVIVGVSFEIQIVYDAKPH